MPRRPSTPAPRPRPRPIGPARRPSPWRRLAPALAALGVLLAAAGAWAWLRESPGRLRARAEVEAAAKDWPSALRSWRALNRTAAADGPSWLGEARACLALGLAAQAERALGRASARSPGDSEPWLLRLEVLRLEDRPLDALRVGWAAYEAVPRSSRRDVLRALTLALLAEAPHDVARATLDRWIEADPADIDAKVARLDLDRRLADHPSAGGAALYARITELEALLGRDPSHVAAREALLLALADAGEADRGRALLDAWPASARDARYERLRARWALDYGARPDEAVAASERALAELPHDVRSRYLLARALQALGRPDEARRAAESVARLRQELDPARLGPRLDADFARLDDPKSRLDLAGLCAEVGLTRLADAWRRDAAEAPRPRAGGLLGLGAGR